MNYPFEEQVWKNQETAIKLLQENKELKKKKKKYKLDKKDLENLKKVREITRTDYKVDENGYIEVEDLTCIIDELLREIEHLEEEKKGIEQDRNDNYVPRFRDKYEEYGVSEKDFY